MGLRHLPAWPVTTSLPRTETPPHGTLISLSPTPTRGSTSDLPQHGRPGACWTRPPPTPHRLQASRGRSRSSLTPGCLKGAMEGASVKGHLPAETHLCVLLYAFPGSPSGQTGPEAPRSSLQHRNHQTRFGEDTQHLSAGPPPRTTPRTAPQDQPPQDQPPQDHPHF